MDKRNLVLIVGLCGLLFVGACQGNAFSFFSTPTSTVSPSPTATLTFTPTETPQPTATPTATPLVPAFDHIIVIVLENKEYDTVIGNSDMPQFNAWAEEYALLTQHYAILHPSLPNYIALLSGDTQGITSNCSQCFIDAPSLPDLLEEVGLTWRAYMEGMPEPCFVGDSVTYFQKHDPFIYFDDIRLNPERCQNIVPMTQLETDLSNNDIANFIFITPDICNDAHDCGLQIADDWIEYWVNRLLENPDIANNSLIIITWDEGQGEHTCCGLTTGGGRVATLLISNRVQPGYWDDTPYTHYSLLRTISTAWGLPLLGHAADPETNLIVAPWN
jgi:hypothetical protein